MAGEGGPKLAGIEKPVGTHIKMPQGGRRELVGAGRDARGTQIETLRPGGRGSAAGLCLSPLPVRQLPFTPLSLPLSLLMWFWCYF
ncbi:hypothetical protein TIFTF001_051980 [Ficus carica]|uniref:Uncharacterized protein n=1 Tax=Ficus carica TaxID=3494 RepID=A0AA88ED65_FICCA|nr:hypothetical protein TIFTF001_051980 [Ficus carica]